MVKIKTNKYIKYLAIIALPIVCLIFLSTLSVTATGWRFIITLLVLVSTFIALKLVVESCGSLAWISALLTIIVGTFIGSMYLAFKISNEISTSACKFEYSIISNTISFSGNETEISNSLRNTIENNVELPEKNNNNMYNTYNITMKQPKYTLKEILSSRNAMPKEYTPEIITINNTSNLNLSGNVEFKVSDGECIATVDGYRLHNFSSQLGIPNKSNINLYIVYDTSTTVENDIYEYSIINMVYN